MGTRNRRYGAVDVRNNSEGLSDRIKECKKRQKNYRQLRVDDRTVIIVPKCKCTEAYKKEYISKISAKR